MSVPRPVRRSLPRSVLVLLAALALGLSGTGPATAQTGAPEADATAGGAASAGFADLDAALAAGGPALPPALPPVLGPDAAAAPLPAGTAGPTALFLAVTINGRDTGLVGAFTQEAGTERLSATPAELRALGLKVTGAAGESVFLDALPGVGYRYDLLAQRLDLTASDAALLPRRLSSRPARDFVAPERGRGAILNYRLDADLGPDSAEAFGGGAAARLFLDARVQAPLGAILATGTLRSPAAGEDGPVWRRLDTAWSHDLPRRMLSVTFGDFVGAGIGWSRPIRMAGLQVRRDFSLREDIVTVPLLSYEGTAAVPSTIDVFIDQVRAYSGRIDPGPFVLTDLPYVTGSGEALIVIEDETGQTRQARVPFFAPRNLLRAGVLDFALQAGLPREGYGGADPGYGDAAVASGSLRYGLTGRLTLEGHAETGEGLVLAGVGLGAVAFDAAELSVATALSDYAGRDGAFAEARLRGALGRAEISLGAMRTFGDFADLAYATDVATLGGDPFGAELADLRPARAREVLSLGAPVIGGAGSIGLSLIRETRAEGTSGVAALSWSQRLGARGAALRLAAFGRSGASAGHGVSAALSIPLGADRRLSGEASDGTSGGRATARLTRFAGTGPGSTGYSASLTRAGDARSADLRLTRETGIGTAELVLQRGAGRDGTRASFAGGLVAAAGGIFAGPQVREAFAVVDAGVPGVAVSLENRPVATTGVSGRALVTGLRPNSRNRISLDTRDLPLDFGIAATAAEVVPARDAGVVLRFDGTTGSGALVALVRPDGSPVPVGATATLDGAAGGAAGSEAVVGYDGLVWLTGLKPRNGLRVVAGAASCRAEFAFRPIPGEQVVIGPVECRP